MASSTDTRELLERENEVARIAEAIAAAAAGRGRALLVEGPPGTGKTSLLEHARRLAEAEGVRPLAARPTRLERGHPFGVVRRLFGPPVRDTGATPACDALTRPPAGDRPRWAVLEELHALLHDLCAEHPVALLVDDAHWADVDSRRFLAFLAPRLEELPALLLAAARPDETPHDAFRGRTASDPAGRPIELRPLSAAACADIVEECLGPAHEAFTDACHAVTDGNPFSLRALLDELRRRDVAPVRAAAPLVARLAPRAVVETTSARISSLSPAAARIAAAVVALAEEATPAHLAVLAGVDEADALTVIEELDAVGLVDACAPVRFRQPILRNAVAADLAPARLADLHGRAAHLLAEVGADEERIAAHLVAVPPAGDGARVRTLRGAARSALRRGATSASVTYLRRALEEPPAADERVELLGELGRAEALVDGPAAIDHLSAALDEDGLDDLRRAELATALARALIFAGRSREAVEVAEQALARLGGADPRRRRALDAVLLAVAHIDPSARRLREEVPARWRGVFDLDADADARALAVGLVSLDAQSCAISAPEAARAVERALADGILLAHDNGGFHFIAAVLVLTMADAPLAADVLEAGLADACSRGDVFARAADEVFTCLVRLRRGEVADAVRAGRDGLAASDAYGVRVGRLWGGGHVATALLEAGDLDAAADVIGSVAAPDPLPEHGFWVPFLDARARVREARGDPQGALEDSLRCGRAQQALGARNPALVPWRSRAARLLAGAGHQRDRALALADEEVVAARAWGTSRALGVALSARGLVRGGARGLEDLREAVAVLDGAGAPLERARALVDLGGVLRRRGDRRAARAPLREAMDLASGCGGTLVAEQARSELRAAGARPRRLALSGPASLTESERRAARLAAQGRTNVEIARTLHVTEKTVETHLGAAFRKLGIRSRRELGAALADVSSG